MDNAITDEAAIREYGLLWSDCQDLAYNEPENRLVLTVGEAAIAAVKTAGLDENFDPEHINLLLTDQENPDHDIDASWIASAVWAGGPVWEKQSDPTKRREFWTWWLDKAVPNAWASRGNSGTRKIAGNRGTQ